MLSQNSNYSKRSYSSLNESSQTGSRKVIAARAPRVGRTKMNMRNEQKKFSTHSNTRGDRKVPRKVPYSFINALYSTPLKVRLTTYGNDYFRLRPSDSTNNGTLFSDNGVKQGLCSALITRAGLKGWSEFCAMPLFNPTGDPCALDVARLQSKCMQNIPATVGPYSTLQMIQPRDLLSFLQHPAKGIEQWLSNIYDSWSDPATTGTSGDKPTNNVNVQKLMNTNFAYYGGKQEHIFTNFTSTHVTLELTEFTPRKPMKQFVPTPNKTGDYQNTGRVMNPIANFIRLDNQLRKPSFKNLNSTVTTAALTPDPTSDDTPFDLEFSAKDAGRFTSAHYTWSKTKRITLDPGDKYIHTMHIPPFYINFGKLLANWLLTSGIKPDITGGNMTNIGEPFNPWNDIGLSWHSMLPDSWPGFTRTLCVQYWGNEVMANSAQPGAPLGTMHPITGPTDICISHKQIEYHSCRHLPEFKTKNYINNNFTQITTQDELDALEDHGVEINEEDNTLHNPGGRTSAGPIVMGTAHISDYLGDALPDDGIYMQTANNASTNTADHTYTNS